MARRSTRDCIRRCLGYWDRPLCPICGDERSSGRGGALGLGTVSGGSLALNYAVHAEGTSIGQIAAFATSTLPAGWLPSDGSTFDPGLYPTLSGLLGSTTVPDLRGRTVIGAGGALGLGTVSGGSLTLNYAVHAEGTSIGQVAAFATSTLPAGWLPSDGSTFDPGLYPALSGLLGSTTAPDLRGRTVIGAGGALGLGTVSGGSLTLNYIIRAESETANTTVTPEPTSLALAGLAGIGMALGALRRRRQTGQR